LVLCVATCRSGIGRGHAPAQPAVVGELLAGVVLGPSLFGWIFPSLQAHIFPKSQAQSDLLSVVSWLGCCFADRYRADRHQPDHPQGETALLISGGIVVPFVTGFGLGWVLPESFLANLLSSIQFVYCHNEHLGRTSDCQGAHGLEAHPP